MLVKLTSPGTLGGRQTVRALLAAIGAWLRFAPMLSLTDRARLLSALDEPALGAT